MNKKTFAIALAQGLGVLIAVAGIYFFEISAGRSAEEVRTLTFAVLVLGNVLLILTNRSWSLTILETIRERKNPTVKWIVGAALLSLTALVEIPALGSLFSLGEITLRDWLLVVGLALLSVSWFELYKLFSRKRSASVSAAVS